MGKSAKLIINHDEDPCASRYKGTKWSAKYMLPVFWLGLFQRVDLAQYSYIENEHTPQQRYVQEWIFSTSKKQAIYQLLMIKPNLRLLFGEAIPQMIDAFIAHLQRQSGDYVHLYSVDLETLFFVGGSHEWYEELNFSLLTIQGIMTRPQAIISQPLPQTFWEKFTHKPVIYEEQWTGTFLDYAYLKEWRTESNWRLKMDPYVDDYHKNHASSATLVMKKIEP